MKKLRQNGFFALEALLIIVFLTVLGLTGYYVWRSRHPIPPKPSSVTIHTPVPAVSGCSTSVKPVQADASVVAEAKAAFIAKGFTETWFDQHFRLVGSETHTNTLTDPSTDWKPKNQVITILSYKMCVRDYNVTVKYDHSDDGNSQSFVEIYTPAHDIQSVISLQEAERSLAKCGGKLTGSPDDSIHFGGSGASGASQPNQARLYLIGTVPNPGNGAATPGTSAIMGGQGGITKSSQANVDLETGKCLVTTSAIGI